MVKTEKKVCTHCKVSKPISDFGKNKGPKRKDGTQANLIRSCCKACKRKKDREYRAANLEKRRKTVRESAARRRAGIERPPPQSWEERKAKQREYKREYNYKRYQTDENYRITKRLRNRLYTALKGKSKAKKTMELVGMPINEFKEYIEAQFIEGMTWNNIDIDHILPCASFIMSDEEEQRKCFHYTNLQPMFRPENQSKGAKITRKRTWIEGQGYIEAE